MRDKKQGGLSVGSLISKNRALLLKWIWRLSSPGTSLWKMIISLMYNPAYENGIPIFYNQPSKIWKDIMSIVQTDVHHIFTNHCKFIVGNDSLTSFWPDNCISDYPLKTTFPRLYLLSSSKSTLVADMGRWSNGIWLQSMQWRKPLFRFEQEQLSLLSSLLDSKSGLSTTMASSV